MKRIITSILLALAVCGSALAQTVTTNCRVTGVGVCIGDSIGGGGLSSSILYLGSTGLLANSANLTFGPAAGQGVFIGAGTATTAVSALSLTSTRNHSASATNWLDFVFTVTASHASDRVLSIKGGVAGATDLMWLTPGGTLNAGGAVQAYNGVYVSNPGATFGDQVRALFASTTDGTMVLRNNVLTAGTGILKAKTFDNDAAATLTLGGTATSLTISAATVTPAASGVRFLCISTTGVVASQAGACVGT